MLRSVWVASLVAICACGRFDFAVRNDATVDAADECAAEKIDLGPWAAGSLMPFSTIGAVEDDPAIRFDGLELIFASDRTGSLGGADFWRVRRVALGDAWGPAEHMDELATAQGENTPTLSEDGLTIFFSSNRPGGVGADDVWTATRPNLDAPFANLRVIGELNSASNDRGPSLFDHDLAMVFFSTRSGGPGAADIYVTRRATLSGVWSAPQVFGAPNTAGDEIRPWLSPCGLEIVFQSGTRNAGNMDFYRARRTSAADAFDDGTRIDELSSAAYDQDLRITPDRHHAFFASASGVDMDVYETYR